MGTIRRGAQNVLRSPVRLVLVVILLGASLAFAAAMLTLNSSAGGRLQDLSSSVGSSIELRPAGSFGAFGTGETLSETMVSSIAVLPDVENVSTQLNVQYTRTDLQPALPVRSGAGGEVTGPGQGTGGTFGGNRRGFAGLALQVVGVKGDASQVTLFGGGTTQVVGGRSLTNADSNADVAMMGQLLAEANNLGVGAQLTIEGTPVQIVGLFSSGQFFGDNSILMPIHSVQRLYGMQGEVTQASVQVSSVDQVENVSAQLRTIVDTNSVEIISDQQRLAGISQSLQAVQASTQTGSIVAVLTAGLVIMFAVVLVVRERRKEIGILKALGASNGHVVGQFAVEVLTLSLAAAVAAFGVLALVGQTITDQFALRGPGEGGFGRLAGGFAGRVGLFPGASVDQAVGSDVSSGLSIESLLLVLGLGVALAVLASIIPAWQVARIKPAEVLRFA